jgi:hypothetical protein
VITKGCTLPQNRGRALRLPASQSYLPIGAGGTSGATAGTSAGAGGTSAWTTCISATAARGFSVAATFQAAALRFLVSAAFVPAAFSFSVFAALLAIELRPPGRNLIVVVAFLAAALRFFVFVAFLPAALNFRVRAAFFASELRFLGTGIPLVTGVSAGRSSCPADGWANYPPHTTPRIHPSISAVFRSCGSSAGRRNFSRLPSQSARRSHSAVAKASCWSGVRPMLGNVLLHSAG